MGCDIIGVPASILIGNILQRNSIDDLLILFIRKMYVPNLLGERKYENHLVLSGEQDRSLWNITPTFYLFIYLKIEKLSFQPITISDFELNKKSRFDKKCLFMFCNRKRDKLKILEWEHNGFWLLDGLSSHHHQADKKVTTRIILKKLVENTKGRTIDHYKDAIDK